MYYIKCKKWKQPFLAGTRTLLDIRNFQPIEAERCPGQMCCLWSIAELSHLTIKANGNLWGRNQLRKKKKKKKDLRDSHHNGKTVNLSIQMLQRTPPEEGNLLYFLIPQQSLWLPRLGEKHFFPSPPCGHSDIVLQSVSTGSMGMYITLKTASVCKKMCFKNMFKN